ncbi:MAG: helix-turn-helix domain-containing protein [Bifidobacteriaceae bacterium]|nr:helix-turn-helix domain-containing protein [Bifidobacteriaceae bacterium]
MLSKHVEIVRLSEAGMSQREISSALRCSLATVNKTLKAARAKGLAELQPLVRFMLRPRP